MCQQGRGRERRERIPSRLLTVSLTLESQSQEPRDHDVTQTVQCSTDWATQVPLHQLNLYQYFFIIRFKRSLVALIFHRSPGYDQLFSEKTDSRELGSKREESLGMSAWGYTSVKDLLVLRATEIKKCLLCLIKKYEWCLGGSVG